MLRHFSREPGFRDDELPSAFGENRNGAVWIGFYSGRFARFRDNRFLFFGPDATSSGIVQDIFTDHHGRLWIARRGRLVCIDEPARDHPDLITYTAAHGLSGNSIVSITEDLFGRIYEGTMKGLDRLDPDGRIDHFTTADGLTPGPPMVAFRDRKGTLWFGNMLGLSSWLPDPPRGNSPPPILIRGVRVRASPSQFLNSARAPSSILAPHQPESTTV